MKADLIRSGLIEMKGADRVEDLVAELLPAISLCQDGLGQALGNVASVGVLSDFEYKLRHELSVADVCRPACLSRTQARTGLFRCSARLDVLHIGRLSRVNAGFMPCVCRFAVEPSL
jgi:hypothetical protein